MLADGGRADGGDAGAQRNGGVDGGVRDGGASGGVDGGVRDGGASDAGASDGGVEIPCDAPVGTTQCGASKIFESSDNTGPSAFDFAAGRALFLATEVTPAQGDFYLFSLETAPTSPGPADALSFVSARDSVGSGGERGNFRQTGIDDLSVVDGGPTNPATFAAIPTAAALRAATRATTHRVPVVTGHVYGLRLDLDADAGTSRHAALYVDRVVTPAGDGGAQRQFVEIRWLLQTAPGRRTFDRSFGPRP